MSILSWIILWILSIFSFHTCSFCTSFKNLQRALVRFFVGVFVRAFYLIPFLSFLFNSFNMNVDTIQWIWCDFFCNFIFKLRWSKRISFSQFSEEFGSLFMQLIPGNIYLFKVTIETLEKGVRYVRRHDVVLDFL